MDSILILAPIFIFESWNSLKKGAKIITSESFVLLLWDFLLLLFCCFLGFFCVVFIVCGFFSLKIFSQSELV